MLDMAAVADASVDAIYSAHNIEHVYAHEVPQVLKEFLRVLKPEGFLVVTCPDLQTVCQLVAEDKLGGCCLHLTSWPDHPAGHPLRPRRSAGCWTPLHGAQDRLHPQDADASAAPGRLYHLSGQAPGAWVGYVGGGQQGADGGSRAAGAGWEVLPIG